jgi:hypothetical protein
VIASPNEIRLAMVGIVRLWRSEPAGLLNFDRSLAGFWRSYCAMLLAAPFYFVLLRYDKEVAPADGLRAISIDAVAYVIGWVAYPLIMTKIVERLDRSDRYFDYMVPYNWSFLPQTALFLAIMLVRQMDYLPTPVSGIAFVVALTAILYLNWFVAKTALDIGRGTAIALVLLDLSLGIFIDGVSSALKG